MTMKKFSILLPLLIAVGSATARGDDSIVRQLQDNAENITATPTPTPSEPEAEGNQTAPDTDIVSQTPWRVQPQPLPENFKLTASFDASNEDSIYLYTVAVAGEVASITSHTGSDNPDKNDPTIYFMTNGVNDCGPTDDDEPHSYMTTSFQELDMSTTPPKIESTKMCWKAPAGHYIQPGSGNPFVHKMIFQIFNLYMKKTNIWTYDGTVSTIHGRADVWNSETPGGGRDIVYLSRSTGEAIKYITRFKDQEIVLKLRDFFAYDDPHPVPNAKLSDEEKESCEELPYKEFVRCPTSTSRQEEEEEEGEVEDDTWEIIDFSDNNSDGAEEEWEEIIIEDLKDAFLEEESSLETGSIEESSDFPVSTRKEYEMKGSEEEQAVVNGLRSFQPGMVGRKMLRVRNQSNCGSCYSFSAAHTITSSYAQENPDSDLLLFSEQHLMNCMPLAKDSFGPAGTGCWAGLTERVIDMVVYYGGKVPLLEMEPYLGVQSHCNLEQDMVDTGITGYSPITTVEQMKNALYFRGDVSVAYEVRDEDMTDLSGDGKVPLPNDNIELHEQAYLGEGISYHYPGSTGHAVAIVGWGPCQVTHCKTGETITDECWIMQNSWGRDSGWDGFYFIHSDLDCDGGILSSGRGIIPIFEKEEKKESTTVQMDMASGAGGVIKFYFMFAVANVALFVLFAY